MLKIAELKGDNPFKIRAYRSAADIVATPDPVAGRTGRTARLARYRQVTCRTDRDICETGTCASTTDLLSEFPPTLLDILRLQGVGPKTVALLYAS